MRIQIRIRNTEKIMNKPWYGSPKPDLLGTKKILNLTFLKKRKRSRSEILTTSISRTAAAVQLLRPDLREGRTAAGSWWRWTKKGVAALHSCWTTALLLLHPLLPSRQVQRGGGWQRWAFAHTIYKFHNKWTNRQLMPYIFEYCSRVQSCFCYIES